MIGEVTSTAANAGKEIPELIEALLATEQRLEELTAGQVDTVTGRDGRTFLLRRAQEQLRHSEAGKQAGILNALPAHIALLDTQGTIVSVNEAWRRFSIANLLPAPGHGVGLNYLAICDAARGNYSSEAHQVGAGIRAVLDGESKSFSIEYPCHSPTEQRWFHLTVTPLSEAHPNGVVVMHVNISERKLAAAAMEALSLKTERRERMLTTMLASLHDFAYIYDRAGRFLYANQPLLDLWGLTLDSIVGKNFYELGYADDLARRLQEELEDVYKTGKNVTGETAYVSPTGVEGVYEYIFSPAFAENGTVEFVVGSTRDITERKRGEAEVLASQKRLRDIIDGIGPSMFVGLLTPQGILVEVNQSPLTAGGLKAEDVLGKPFDETPWWSYSPAVQHQLRDAITRAARGEASRYDVRTQGAGNQFIDIDFSLQPLRNPAGEVVFLIPSGSVITERKLAETALRESEAEFRSLAEAMPQMVWITQPNGWNIYFSQQWMDYTGLTLEESLGHGWNKPFHPEDQQSAWDAWQLATATIGVYSIECRLRRADGAYRWWLVRGVPQKDTSGNILKWFGTCTDIHEMKLAELEISRANQALSASDEKFRQLADNITDVFWITSPNFKIVEYVSAGYELLWGNSAESLYAHPDQWAEAILPEERENALAVLATLMGTAPAVSVEYRIARPDGTVRWIRDRGFQIRDAAGKLIRLTGIASDITEQKKLEAQLRQAQKMEAIGTLAGGIAHDFNNILAAIIGYSEMAQRGLSPDIRPHAHLQQVLIASNRARDLVRQILTFSRQEEPERKPLELQSLIYETMSLMRVSLPTTIAIYQNIDATVPSVLGDATQIQQAIMNLLINAGQAMKKHGGVLGVHLTSIDIDHEYATAHPELNEGPHVCLAVSDTGSGMDYATQARIFEPFFTTKAPGEGTGLGLAVVHGIIKNHGGVIVVSSELGAGTTFSIYLPVYDRRHRALNKKADPLPRGNGEHILFVDDEEVLVSLGKSMLEYLGYRVTTRTDSIGALEIFRSQPEDFDMVITDQTMPHLSGADLATALLETRPALPVILVTGYSSDINPEKAKAIGIRELLSKPNTMQSLGETIQRVLGQRRKE